MSVDFFIKKFKDKNYRELNEIVNNCNKYVIEARIAALRLMKNSSYESINSINIEDEFHLLENDLNIQLNNKLRIEREIAQKLWNIKVNKTLKIKLPTKNELQIKRLSKNFFQIRIEHYKSWFSPVAICFLNEKGEKDYLPFFYLNSILFSVIISLSIILYFYFTQKIVPEEIFDFSLWLIVGTAVLQIIMAPFNFPWIVNTFKEEIEKNIS